MNETTNEMFYVRESSFDLFGFRRLHGLHTQLGATVNLFPKRLIKIVAVSEAKELIRPTSSTTVDFAVYVCYICEICEGAERLRALLCLLQ